MPRDSQKGHGTVGAQLAIVLVLKLQVLVSPLILDGGCQHPEELREDTAKFLANLDL